VLAILAEYEIIKKKELDWANTLVVATWADCALFWSAWQLLLDRKARIKLIYAILLI